MGKSEYHRVDERRFLDERGSNISLAPNGLNPVKLLEKAVIERIVESYFWKEQCFAINEADIVDRVVEHVDFVGGMYGDSQKPSPFLCLVLKLLMLAPNDAILHEYLDFGGEKFKYLRALALFYVRLTRADKDVYTTLEPFLVDRRKLRRKGRNGQSLTYIDEFVDDLLTKERVCATTLWKMRKRDVLEDLDQLEPRESPLGNIEDLLEEDDDMEMRNGNQNGGYRSGSEDGEQRSSRTSLEGSDDGRRDKNGMDVDEDKRWPAENRGRSRSP